MTCMCYPNEIVIRGITESGQRFRPSDWPDRLGETLSQFGRDRKIEYSPYVRPIVYNDERCVAINPKLETADPSAYQVLMNFARDNHLQVMQCSRLKFEAQAAGCPLLEPEEPLGD